MSDSSGELSDCSTSYFTCTERIRDLEDFHLMEDSSSKNSKKSISKYDVSSNIVPQDGKSAEETTGGRSKKGREVGFSLGGNKHTSQRILAAFLADEEKDDNSNNLMNVKPLPLSVKFCPDENSSEDEMDYGYEKVDVGPKTSSDSVKGNYNIELEIPTKARSKLRDSPGNRDSQSSTKSSVSFGNLESCAQGSFRLAKKRLSRSSFSSNKSSISSADSLSDFYGMSGNSKSKRDKRKSFSLVRPKQKEPDSDGSGSDQALRQYGSAESLVGHKRQGLKSILKNHTKSIALKNYSFGEDNRPSKSSDPRFLHMSLANVDRLSGNQQTEAAATIVSASAMGGSRAHVHFSIGDKVLAFFSILNHIISQTKDDEQIREPTKNLVNKYGYPPGNGYAIEEQRGPYTYVLCTIKAVHFEEFERYYTVTRMDTGQNQRANPEWLEPILTDEGKIAALKAARADLSTHDTDELNSKVKLKPLQRRCSLCIQPINYTRRFLTNFLLGNIPFSLRFQFSSINLLVICGFIFNFLDQLRLVCPIRFDSAFEILLGMIWFILVAELICEILIRPKDYKSLINSKDQYDPSLARYVMRYHLVAECVSLIAFLPELYVIFMGKWNSSEWSLLACCMSVVSSSTLNQAIRGQVKFIFIRLRIIGLVRQWKNMWLNRTYEKNLDKNNSSINTELPQTNGKRLSKVDSIKQIKSQNTTGYDDHKLRSAAHIGTALMMTNSHRTSLMIIFIAAVSPFFYITVSVASNTVNEMTELLQQNNIGLAGNDTSTCQLLQNSSIDWLESMLPKTNKDNNLLHQNFLLWAQILPVRCQFQEATNGVITICPQNYTLDVCINWEGSSSNSTPEYFAENLDLRVGSINTINFTETIGSEIYNVTAMFSEHRSVKNKCISSMLLQLSALIVILGGLTRLRDDLTKLALNPLHRMLSIVLLYAKNPLASREGTLPRKKKRYSSISNENKDVPEKDEKEYDEVDLGRFETEQLINAVTKITGLLRKCWGVAGANIISSNLAREEGGSAATFNPCVPGRKVYALFGFVTINDFPSHLRSLEQDIMILINDVASVVHEEVFRWGYGTSGQCNKNLGDSFLMVFRIGEFEEVEKNKKRASEFIFSSPNSEETKKSKKQVKSSGKPNRRKKNKEDKWSEGIVLASLPGIGAFTDRAIIGMLKSFAGIHRSERLRDWKKDFRLGAGVGAFTIGMIFGMDAGWAVEGAVGSEYKVDATYLSPHVNMAARMMSACRQFGVTILLSNAIQELVSEECSSKLRHIDTVTVKGSSVRQKIYTYDAREVGVDFFLYGQTDKKSDLDSELYSSSVWNTDQDLTAMRRHVTDDFIKDFNLGRDAYLRGDWENSIKYLKQADASMIQMVLDEGYLAYDQKEYLSGLSKSEKERLSRKAGDGPSRCLIEYMEKLNGVAPSKWNGVRPLTSK